jgi:hypothetical protein
VMTMGSLVEFTSSIISKQRALNSLTEMVFIYPS